MGRVQGSIDVKDLHVGLVIIAYLLHMDVVYRVDVRLGGGVTIADRYNTSHILEVIMIGNSNLENQTVLIFTH